MISFFSLSNLLPRVWEFPEYCEFWIICPENSKLVEWVNSNDKENKTSLDRRKEFKFCKNNDFNWKKIESTWDVYQKP